MFEFGKHAVFIWGSYGAVLVPRDKRVLVLARGHRRIALLEAVKGALAGLETTGVLDGFLRRGGQADKSENDKCGSVSHGVPLGMALPRPYRRGMVETTAFHH